MDHLVYPGKPENHRCKIVLPGEHPRQTLHLQKKTIFASSDFLLSKFLFEKVDPKNFLSFLLQKKTDQLPTSESMFLTNENWLALDPHLVAHLRRENGHPNAHLPPRTAQTKKTKTSPQGRPLLSL